MANPTGFIDTADVEELQNLLEAYENSMDVGVLDGFLTAAALNPNRPSNEDVIPYVFDEEGVVVGLLGDEFFIGSFEQRVDGGGTGFFGDVDEAFQPFEAAHAQGHAHRGALAVGSGPADGLGAGTYGGHGHFQLQQKARTFLPLFQFAGKAALVLHGSAAFRHRSLARAEIGEGEAGVGAAGVQTFEHVGKQALHGGVVQLFRAGLAPVFQRLDETAHMRSLEGGRKVDSHVDAGHGVLAALVAVLHHEGQLHMFHAHAVDVERHAGRTALYVLQ